MIRCTIVDPANSEPIAVVTKTTYCLKEIRCMVDNKQPIKRRRRPDPSGCVGGAREPCTSWASTNQLTAMMMRRRQQQQTFLRVGLPLVVFVVGGFIGLKEFIDGKIEVLDSRVKSQTTRELNLEEEHRVRI